MDHPESLHEEFEAFVATVLQPNPLHTRFQNLITNVWIWGQQMRKNSKNSTSLSPAIHSAVFAFSHVVTFLDHVLTQYYENKTICSSLEEIDQDLSDFETFVSMICEESDQKLILRGLNNEIMMIFPRGTPFIAHQTLYDVYGLTGINAKADKLLDQQLGRRFKNALHLLSTTMQNSWPHTNKKYLENILVDDKRVTFAKQLKVEARIQELEDVRSDLLRQSRNAQCNDRRVKGWVKNISIAEACEETGEEMRKLKNDLEVCRVQISIFEQICVHYSLKPDADSSAAAAALYQSKLE